MPEFILDRDGDVSGLTYDELDAFTRGYIEAMFFTESSPAYMSHEWEGEECQHAVTEGQADGNIPGDVGFADLDLVSLANIIVDCSDFQRANRDLLAQAYTRADYDEMAAGRDFWYTRNGHGVGYWDRKQLEADGLGDKLSDACKRTECNLFYQDGKVYVE